MNKFVDNYCRHVGCNGVEATGKVRFFCVEPPPIPEHELMQWAFYRIPDGQKAYQFKGKLIGESQDMRMDRLGLEKVLS